MPLKVIVCDIEGTTSSISFVKDTLFPYALQHVEQYLNDNWSCTNVQEAVKELREQSAKDETDKIDGVVPISDGEGQDQQKQIAEIVSNVKWQINNDRKTTSLKKLQGLIWAKGYDDGTIKGHVYSDVPKAFDRWTTGNVKLYIYSSGSEAAQQLLFCNTEHGDLTPKISGYFDTRIGAKQVKDSYEKIIKEVGCDAQQILFLTDIVNEAKAARQANMQVIILDRSGNSQLTDEERNEFEVLTSFENIDLDSFCLKRKADDNLTEEASDAKIIKLNADESTKTETVPESNGINTTDNTNNDETMEIAVLNENGTDITMNNKKKTDDEFTNLNVDVAKNISSDVKNLIDSSPFIENSDEKMHIANDPIDDGQITLIDAEMKIDSESKEQAKLIEPLELVEQVESKKLAAPVEPILAVKPVESVEETKPVELTESVESVDLIKPVESGESIKPVKSVDPVDPVDPVEPVESVESVKSVDPVEPIDSVESLEPVCSNELVDTHEKDSDKCDKKNDDIPVIQRNDDVKQLKETTSPDEMDDKKDVTDNINEENVNVTSSASDDKMIEITKETTDDKVIKIENGDKECVADKILTDNKENIPIDGPNNEKQNIIDIPIHVDNDGQSVQKQAPNGNGTTSGGSNDDSGNKEKMSRIELIIEEKDNENGQLTQTTTHIVKEITIVKKSVCESSNGKPAEIV